VGGGDSTDMRQTILGTCLYFTSIVTLTGVKIQKYQQTNMYTYKHTHKRNDKLTIEQQEINKNQVIKNERDQYLADDTFNMLWL